MSHVEDLRDLEVLRDRFSFRAMGTVVSIVGPGASDGTFLNACASVETVFAREEQRFSRFRAESELSIVNGSAGRWTPVSPPFQELVEIALKHAERTDGLFDPAVLDAMIAAGYDRDFDEVIAGARGALRPPPPCGRWREIEIRPGAILLPIGVGIDLGGIAKGWTVDLAAEAAMMGGLAWALVSAGGDLRIVGDAPEIDVRIEDPNQPDETAAWLRLASGALASSSIVRRSWGPDLHHIVDPRTGAPADPLAVQATVWATTCAEAEVLSTWALLEGTGALDAVPCAFVFRNGDMLLNFGSEVAA
jgi:thiamine biosynthesis lipoprotein